MRSLAQPEVLKSASTATLITSLACYLRLAQWETRKYPVWYLEAVLIFGGFVLWAFVFAWHAKYAQRPVFVIKPEAKLYTLSTLTGIFIAVLLHFFLDPVLRIKAPEDYPKSFAQWIAITLFTLTFTQLFLVFAPFAWSIRIFQRSSYALLFTVLLGVFVMAVKNHVSPTPLPSSLLLAVLLVRLVAGLLSVILYLRGGVTLVLWWSFILQSRYLLDLGSN